jgi:hypothetical protein
MHLLIIIEHKSDVQQVLLLHWKCNKEACTGFKQAHMLQAGTHRIPQAGTGSFNRYTSLLAGFNFSRHTLARTLQAARVLKQANTHSRVRCAWLPNMQCVRVACQDEQKHTGAGAWPSGRADALII